MRKTLKITALLMALAMFFVVFAGCGGNNNDETTTAEDTTVEDSTEAKTVLVVGTNPEFPPFEYINDSGEMDGFDIALIKAMAEKMNMEVRLENLEFKALIGAIGNRIDIAIAGMTVTDERLESVDFTDSYFTATQFVLVADDNDDIKTADDLAGKKIGVQEGTTGDFIATDDIADTDVSRYSKAVTAVMDLANGKLDAVIIDKNPALEFVNMQSGIKIVEGELFEPENYAIAVPKNNADLLANLNQVLADVRADGTYDALMEEYIIGTESETESE